jgi:hypothetical protein
LFALGKTEDDFPWDEKPKVLHLTADVLDSCYDYLRPKRKPRTADDLHVRLFIKGYLTFSRQELLDALRRDSRFVVTSERHSFSAEVKVVRKSRRSRGRRRAEGQAGHEHGRR